MQKRLQFFSQEWLQLHLQVGLRPTVSGAVQILSDLEVRTQISRRKQLTALNFRPILDFPASSRANLGVRGPARVGGAADLRAPARLAPPARNRPLLVDRTSDPHAHLARPPARQPATHHRGSGGHHLLTPARRMHSQKLFEERRGRDPRPHPLSFSRLLCFLRSHHWLPASDTGRTAGLRRDAIGRRRRRSAGGLLAIGRGAAGGLNRSPGRGGFCQSATLGPAAA